MHEHSQSSSPADFPSCCGTGCAVCVLDGVIEHAAPANERAQCCNTGCLICVRDYPELVLPPDNGAQILQLLEAVETAQQT